MTTDLNSSASLRIVVHAKRCDSETLAAVVVALTSSQPSHTPPMAHDAWQSAALHESRSDQQIYRPQQLHIRGNQQW